MERWDTPAIRSTNRLLRYLEEKAPGRVLVIDRDDPHYIHIVVKAIPVDMCKLIRNTMDMMHHGDEIIVHKQR